MWQACALVFISSACVLVIELIAGRIMAPYVGVSLYTWTSIIGIVLAGMSVGNYLGGVVGSARLASPARCHLRRRQRLLSPHPGHHRSRHRPDLSSVAAPSNRRLHDGDLPAAKSRAGHVSPLVVKLALADLQRTGNTSARSTPSPPRGRSSARSSPGSGSSPGWAPAASSGLSLACCC